MSDIAASPRSRRPAVFVFALFFLPLIAAFVLYYFGAWRPAGSTAHGDLIHPARPLPTVVLHDSAGNPLASNLFTQMWSLVYLGDGRCDTRCRAALADMQRARELLGKDISRVQSVFLVTAQCCDESLRTTYPKLTIARVDEPNATQLLAQFPTYQSVPLSRAGRIYIVDPLGNLMMSYAADAPSVGIYNDLKKLLELSHIG